MRNRLSQISLGELEERAILLLSQRQFEAGVYAQEKLIKRKKAEEAKSDSILRSVAFLAYCFLQSKEREKARKLVNKVREMRKFNTKLRMASTRSSSRLSTEHSKTSNEFAPTPSLFQKRESQRTKDSKQFRLRARWEGQIDALEK